jgi:opacity protein-like surface antigen
MRWGIRIMKRTWLAIAMIALFAASSEVSAADFDYNRGFPLPLTYSWDGFYVGPNLGVAGAVGTVTDNRTGLSFSGDRAGFMGGIQGGYNWQFMRHFVAGIEGVFDYTSINKTTGAMIAPVSGHLLSIDASAGTRWVGTIAARFGYAQNNWLFYSKLGGGWAENTAAVNNLIIGGSARAPNTPDGMLAGLGIEYGLTANWTVKAEYDYLGLSSWSTASHLFSNDSISVSRQFNMFTVGANYKFW